MLILRVSDPCYVLLNVDGSPCEALFIIFIRGEHLTEFGVSEASHLRSVHVVEVDVLMFLCPEKLLFIIDSVNGSLVHVKRVIDSVRYFLIRENRQRGTV